MATGRAFVRLLASTMENMKLFYEKTNAGRAPRRGISPTSPWWTAIAIRCSPIRSPGAGPDRAHGSAPASKLLHGSDIQALPEPLALAPDWARSALVGALAWLLERGELTFDESHEIAPAKSSRKMP